MKIRLLVALAAVASSPLLMQSSQAAPAPPTATGCYDILPSSGTASQTDGLWDRLVQSVDQETKNATLGLYGPATITYKDRGVFDAQMELAAPSCTDVTYVATLTSADGSTAVTTLTAKGDGVSSSLHLEGVVDHYGQKVIGARYSTVDSRGRTIDTIGSGISPAQIADDASGAGANFG